MYPGVHSVSTPEKPALIMAPSGEEVTYRELDERSVQLSRVWHELGLRRGDHVCVFMENHPRYFEVVWAALRSGLYLTTINSYLTAEEVAYILEDAGARSVVVSPAKAATTATAVAIPVKSRLPG